MTETLAGSVWQHSAVNVVTRQMQAAVLRDLAHGLPLDREALAFEIPGANPLDVEVALEVLLRGNLVRIVPTSGVDGSLTPTAILLSLVAAPGLQAGPHQPTGIDRCGGGGSANPDLRDRQTTRAS